MVIISSSKANITPYDSLPSSYLTYESSSSNAGLLGVEEKLRELVKKNSRAIRVVGIGGAGNNTLNNLMEFSGLGFETIAINTDAQDLLNKKAHKKILIGEDLTHGLGTGADPEKGRKAAENSSKEIQDVLDNADMVFITCGLGGGTGSGAAPVIAAIAKKTGALVVGIVTLPFEAEGKQRWENSKKAFREIENIVHTLIVVPNDKLLNISPTLSLKDAFKLCDNIISNAVKGIADMVVKPGLINLDFNDVRSIMKEGGVAMIGVSSITQNNEGFVDELINNTTSNPLLSVDISDATGMLINITINNKVTLPQVNQIIKKLDNMAHGAKKIWGCQYDEAQENAVKLLLLITNVNSAQILGPRATMEKKATETLARNLNIEALTSGANEDAKERIERERAKNQDILELGIKDINSDEDDDNFENLKYNL
ncbi:MAG: cell division protein FtsZ [Candidatus Huberarchaeum crystalense]|uniref:Cell division protein FtsZ n=1 Tax=Huberarchaeum crystalense TaxID=2014257 RepID=A0A2G9LJD2_HUBC1|nr:cell division protein FtsZ [archaeon]OIP20808.1 MAG: cell division protein FtsZ [archaeon CG2_30_31_98]PIN66631.1 MAG: cell division protein FtsZ [Candidatus Huberarchaeum crystalense]NCS98498.1 cell division protein FtsZ [archaeon]PIV13497.1 MAG: cell division protein FtsZ [Candidatus Huberarchaeum crystalense]